MTQGPESRIESYLRTRVKSIGGLCIKFVPVIAGMPDRIVLLPGGRVFFVELKAPDGRLRPVQRVWHDRFAQRGTQVVVLASKDAVDLWVDSESKDVFE